MKNKYQVMKTKYSAETDSYEEVVRNEVVADVVVNQEGYLTFLNTRTEDKGPELVQIIAENEWTRVVNMGPFIAEVGSDG